MLTFDYVVKDKLGIHARPAGMMVKEGAKFNSAITITKGEKTADVKKLFALMGLGVKYDDAITFTIDGEDESAAYDAFKQFAEKNL